jgi:squalene synthase HpnD
MSTPLGAAQADLDEVERLVRASGTSFYRGMRILPPDRRMGMYAIYAFCRLVDDIADEDAPLDEKRHGLDAWRARIEALEAGQAEDEVSRVLLRARAKFALRRADFLAIIDGMQMDAETVIIAPPLDVLDLYCDRVASAVGRLSVRAFGDASAAADEVAHHLGRALQLTNILRDLSEDAERGRLYLPAEFLAEAGVPADPRAALKHPGLIEICERLATRAKQHFHAASEAMSRCDRRAMKPARLMGASYAAILRRLERRGWSHPEQRVRVPKWGKLWIALRFALS